MNIARLSEIRDRLTELNVTESELTELIEVSNIPVNVEYLATRYIEEFTQDFIDLIKSAYKDQFDLESVLHSADWDRVWEYIDTYGIER